MQNPKRDDSSSQATDNDDEKASSITTSSTLMWFVGGLSLASCASSALYLHDIYNETGAETSFLDKFPTPTFAQCTSLIGVTIAILFVYVYELTVMLHLVRLNMPVVSSNIPYFGHAFEFLNHSPWDLMCDWQRRYGSIYAFRLLGSTVVPIASPEYLKAALQSQIAKVKKDVTFAYKPFLAILGKGIVTSEGKPWMKQRLKMSSVLRITVLDRIPRITLQAVQRLCETKLDPAAKDGTPIELAEELRHLTLQVISNTFLSLSAEESDSTFAKMYLPIVEECNKRVWNPERAFMFFMPFFWSHLRAVKTLNDYVSKLIRDRWALRQSGNKEEGEFGDILDHLLQHYEKGNPGRTRMSRDAVVQLRDEMKTFMLAGHETSAAMMTWALLEIMTNESITKEVTKEAEGVFGKPSGMDWCAEGVDHTSLPSREEGLSKLIVSEACLKEALRKYSVVPTVMRRVGTKLTLGPHELPAGCAIMINVQAVHHNPKFWPDPMKFDPHRFIESRPAPYTFLPFLEGPRNCLGQYLALLESKMVVALLSQRYQIKLADGDLTRRERHRFIVPVVPKDEMNVSVTRR